MSKKDSKLSLFSIIICVIIYSCSDNIEVTKKENNAIEVAGKLSNYEIYNKIKDSLLMYKLNKFDSYNFLNSGNWYLDSIICSNSNNSRFITCVLYTNSNFNNATHDGIVIIYGEKIISNWFCFKGPAIHIPREIVKGQDIHKPLSYQQLHEIALKEVYGGYLNEKGEINEAWFTSQFEGQGWGDFEHQEKSDWILKGKRFNSKKEFYEFLHLEKVKSNWLQRDTTALIKNLPEKEIHDSVKLP